MLGITVFGKNDNGNNDIKSNVVKEVPCFFFIIVCHKLILKSEGTETTGALEDNSLF